MWVYQAERTREEVAMPLLIIAAPVRLAIHLGISGTVLSTGVVRLIGELAFRAVLSVLSLAFLIWAWIETPTTAPWAVAE
jgi:hypothetical protein